MSSLKFPQFARTRHEIRNLNEIVDERITPGQRATDRVASIVGSWRFIIIQTMLLILWVIVNISGWILAWDPYPFILMNLVLSTQAAFTAPIIMMSQNRQATIDRIEAHNDYQINVKTADDVNLLLQQIEAQNQALITLHQMLEQMQHQLDASMPPKSEH